MENENGDNNDDGSEKLQLFSPFLSESENPVRKASSNPFLCGQKKKGGERRREKALKQINFFSDSFLVDLSVFSLFLGGPESFIFYSGAQKCAGETWSTLSLAFEGSPNYKGRSEDFILGQTFLAFSLKSESVRTRGNA